MEKLKPWIASLRLSMTLLAAFLVYAGFAVAEKQVDFKIMGLVFLGACATMLQNDYFDRSHDVLKGKRLAYDNPNLLAAVLILLWGTLVFLSWNILESLSLQAYLLMYIVLVGILYSFTRKFFPLPLLLTSLTSAVPALFAFSSDLTSWKCIILFFSVFAIITAREIIKDTEDSDVDVGYKHTLLTLNIFKKEEALRISAVLIFAGVCLAITLHPGPSILPWILFAGGIACCLTSAVILWKNRGWDIARQRLDIGMVLVLLSIAVGRWLT